MKSNVENCIGLEDLQAYADGTLDSFARASVKAHLDKCPICADIYEGLQIAAQQNINVDLETEKLNTRISDIVDKKQHNKRPTITVVLSALAVAASIAAVYLVFNGVNKSQNINEIDVVAEHNPNTTEPNLPQPEEPDNTSDNAQNVADNPVKPSQPEAKSDDKPLVQPAQPSNPNESVVLRGGDSEKDNKSMPPETLSAINKLISAGEFFDAKDILEDILNDYPDDYNAHYCLGVCNVNLGYYQPALNTFERIENVSDLDQFAVKYYKALCLIHLDRKPEAKKLLGEVNEHGGEYGKKAAEVLLTLGD